MTIESPNGLNKGLKLENDPNFINILENVRADIPDHRTRDEKISKVVLKESRSEEEIQKLAQGSFQTIYPEEFAVYENGSNGNSDELKPSSNESIL